jgi:mannose-6-phosphate isomerase-like protein (cupin superfamily)
MPNDIFHAVVSCAVRFGLFAGLAAAVLSSAACATAGRAAPPNLKYERITLSPDPVEQPLLTGPPQTGGMRSGRVVLKAGEAMHRHSTRGNEELLVVLQGKARVLLGRETLSLEAGQVLYIPPETEHELRNESPDELRYIYTVAPAAR